MTQHPFGSDLLNTAVQAATGFRAPLSGAALHLPELHVDLRRRGAWIVFAIVLAVALSASVRLAMDRHYEAVRTIHTPEMADRWAEALR